jgi:2-oxoglutarate/2-oxoacid ferredoxin oxidoreductase subunit alpha
MAKELLKGNHAFAEAAVRAGLQAYFGYPITPQTEALEYLSARMPELGRAFVQAESELGAANMVYGAACTGVRVMSSSSSPGISLMQEALSYIAGTELPCVMVNVNRGGPGLGNLAPAQSDYNQMCKNGGHGDYHQIVLAPANVQELIDITVESFDLAEKYRSIVMILIDGSIGQIMEPAVLPPMQPLKTTFPEWAVRGHEGGKKHFLSSIYITPPDLEATNMRIARRWQQVTANEQRWKEYYMDGAKYAVVAFGSAGRIAFTAVQEARAKGIPVGLIRPISLNPFPEKIIEQVLPKMEGFLVVEENAGMMLDDLRLLVQSRVPVEFYGRTGGVVPLPDEILEEIGLLVKGPLSTAGNPRDRWLERLAKKGI